MVQKINNPFTHPRNTPAEAPLVSLAGLAKLKGLRSKLVAAGAGASFGIYSAEESLSGGYFRTDTYSFFYSLSGPHDLCWDDGCGRLRTGLLRSRECFLWDSTRPNYLAFRHRVEFVGVHLAAGSVQEVALHRLKRSPVHILPRSQFRDPLVESLCLKVKGELEHGTAHGTVILSAIATVLTAHLLDSFVEVPAHPAQPKRTQLRGLTERQLKAVTEHIDSHLSQTLSLEALAKVASLSAYHFLRSFQKTVGKTPHQYVIERRVELAKKLLDKPDQSLALAQIAVDCGFSDQSHLNAQFRKLVGTTPGRYARRVR